MKLHTRFYADWRVARFATCFLFHTLIDCEGNISANNTENQRTARFFRRGANGRISMDKPILTSWTAIVSTSNGLHARWNRFIVVALRIPTTTLDA